MKDLDWARIQDIFHAARELSRSERPAFVAKASDNNPALIHKVSELLEAHDSLGDFLNEPVVQLTVPSSGDDLLGITIGDRYLIEKEVGHGGMGDIYLASDLNLHHRPVVIKFLSRHLLEDSYALKKFKQETEALSRIRHEGVVEVQDRGEFDGRPYFVMQYVEGNSLRSQISNDGMDLERAAAILKQVGAALRHVHVQGVVHRDLKPENILLKRSSDAVVLVDFGIARVKDSLVTSTTANGESPGTLRYMSPEQLNGEEITSSSDVYSMGVVAYEMVTGRRPFNPSSSAQLLDQQRRGVRVKPVDLRENLSKRAQTIILRALSFAPADRYNDASELGDKLAEALVEGRVAPTKKPPLKVVGAFLLVLIVAAFMTFGIYKYMNQATQQSLSRSFTYFITVQRMHDDKPYQDSFKSNGDNETFGNGDQFQLTVFAPTPGYLYIFSEGPPQSNDTSFNMIYPSRSINNGSSSLGANQQIQSEWFTFRGTPGNENFWIVWSNSPVSQLESAATEAFKEPNRGLTGQTLISTKEYLMKIEAELGSKPFHYSASQTVVVRGKSDMLVTLAQFKHR